MEVPLVPLIHSLIEEKISVDGLVLFPVGLVLSLVVMIFVGQIILFLLSIYYAYAGHKVTSYVVPSTKPLLATCKICQDKPMSEVLKQEIVELENSLNSVRRNLDEKSKYVKKKSGIPNLWDNCIDSITITHIFTIYTHITLSINYQYLENYFK